ncbi:MAG: ATP-binding protein [Oleibacter sp.]|nr:ATP-binding protein [Thalassolituus sp.]
MTILCLVALQLVNKVRLADYEESLIRGSLYLIAQALERDSNASAAIETQFSGQLQLFPDMSEIDDDYRRSRLERNEAVISRVDDSSNLALDYRFNQGWLRLTISNLSLLQIEATAALLQQDWLQSDLSPEDYLNRVRPSFGYPLTLLAKENAESFDSEQATRISLTQSGQQVMVDVALINHPWSIRLGPWTPYTSFAWPSVLVIVLSGILLIGLGVYWVVNSFEVRLRKLEQATTRLAQGHLNVRVHSEGSDPVSRLGQSFNAMAEHIQRLLSIQREMVRAVSHELRTPVARIRFGAQIIEDSTADDPFVAKQLKGMDADIQELDELIDEILTYARLEEGGPVLDFQRVPIADIADQVVHEARPPEQVKVTYNFTGDPAATLCEVEPRYAHRAIQNLVGNAGRYAKSQVRVVCHVTQDVCRIDVEDDGAGIPEEDWGRVFTAFARLDDSRTRASGGYGLGLSIVRRIMYWHDGKAMVSRSDTLGGAKFTLIWPRVHSD